MKIKMIRQRLQGGFSLLELMLVVAIIALISVAALPQVNEYNKRSRSARSSQNLKTLVSGVQQFTLDKSGPPAGSTVGWTTAAIAASTAMEKVDSAGLGSSIARYVQVNESLFESPNRTAFSASTTGNSYGYKVVSVPSGDGSTESFEGLVASAFNTTKRFEPADSSTDGAATGYAINGYEDIGRYDPSGAAKAPLVYKSADGGIDAGAVIGASSGSSGNSGNSGSGN